MYIIVDGSSLICTRFFGSVPPEVMRVSTSEEEKAKLLSELPNVNYRGTTLYTNALDGYFNALTHILTEFTVDGIAVCFDRSSEDTFRRKAYPPYKAQRGQKPPQLKQQMIAAQDLTRIIGIPVLMAPEYEADDFAGSMAKKLEQLGGEVALLTSDRDYLQLVNDKITVWMMRSASQIAQLENKHGPTPKRCPSFCYAFTPEIIRAETGVLPSQIVDWKALAGDSSDNIPGCQGIGDKTSVKILEQAGSLDAALADIDALNIQQKYKDALRTDGKGAKLSQFLATIITNLEVPMPAALEDVKINTLASMADVLKFDKTSDLLEAKAMEEVEAAMYRD